MHIKETPLHHVRGKTFLESFRAYRKGEPANLTGHRIRFAIADRDTMARLVMVETGNGIEQDALGNFEVTVPAAQMRRTTLPESEYWYEVEVWENEDPNRKFTLLEGTLHLSGSPFE